MKTVRDTQIERTTELELESKSSGELQSQRARQARNAGIFYSCLMMTQKKTISFKPIDVCVKDLSGLRKSARTGAGGGPGPIWGRRLEQLYSVFLFFLWVLVKCQFDYLNEQCIAVLSPCCLKVGYSMQTSLKHYLAVTLRHCCMLFRYITMFIGMSPKKGLTHTFSTHGPLNSQLSKSAPKISDLYF